MEEEKHCFTNLTIDQQYSSIALSGVCLISFIVSIPAVLLAVHEYCIKKRLTDMRTERLLLYLVCGSSLVSLVGCFHWVGPLTLHSNVAKHACAVVGYLWLLSSTFSFTITLCTGIHFLVQICKPKLLTTTKDEVKIVAKRMEMLYVSVSLFAAVVLTPWPFLNNAFGYNLWICWIVTTNENCKINGLAATEATVYYVAVLSIVVFSFSVIFIVHILICFRKRNIQNLYVWAFSVYLISLMLNFTVTLVVNFLKVDEVPVSVTFLKLAALGLSPLIASIVIIMAVVYKKFFDKRYVLSSGHYVYNSIESDNNSMARFKATSRASTTHWKSPPTEIQGISTATW